MDTKAYFFYRTITGHRQEVIAPETAKALAIFCKQEPEFAQAVEQSGKTFQECLNEITKDLDGRYSVLEVLERAVGFYFPGAEVHYCLQLTARS